MSGLLVRPVLCDISLILSVGMIPVSRPVSLEMEQGRDDVLCRVVYSLGGVVLMKTGQAFSLVDQPFQ